MPAKTNILIKVCGMRDPANISAVAELQPDYMGFIFYHSSKRSVGEDFKMPALSSSIRKVGVFVNEKISHVVNLAGVHKLDFVQLHGDETPEMCNQLKGEGIGVIKALPIHDQFDFSSVKEFKTHVDYFLFDTKTDGYGGSGKTFDWTLLRHYDQEVPFFLSGGLSVSNIEELVPFLDLNVHALDLNSGIERSPGVKDTTELKKIKRFLNV